MSNLRVLSTMVCVLLCAGATAAQTPPGQESTPPTAVTLTTDSDRVQSATDDPNEPLRLNYVGLMPVLIKAIQEQQAALEEKEAEIRVLHARDREQETRLTILEARLQQVLKDSPTREHLNKRPNN